MAPHTSEQAARHLSMRNVFEDIYTTQCWSLSYDTQPSTFEYIYKVYLGEFLAQHSIRSVLDVGCGYFRWMRELDWSSVHYTGMDVVPEVIRYNREHFETENVRFQLGDGSIDDLPSADLLLMKDVLQHWPNTTIRAFLPKIRNFQYALMSNDYLRTGSIGQDIAVGQWRPIDLAGPPYSLPVQQVLTMPWYDPRDGTWYTKTTVLYEREA